MKWDLLIVFCILLVGLGICELAYLLFDATVVMAMVGVLPVGGVPLAIGLGGPLGS